jgi:hypothetical protein
VIIATGDARREGRVALRKLFEKIGLKIPICV